MALRPSCTRHTCPQSLPHCAAVGGGHETAKHMFIHCLNFLAARHTLKTIRGTYQSTGSCSPPLAGLQKGTGLVIERGILGQCQRARGFLYPLGPSSPANNEPGQQSWNSTTQQLTRVSDGQAGEGRFLFPMRVFLPYMLLHRRSAWATLIFSIRRLKLYQINGGRRLLFAGEFSFS